MATGDAAVLATVKAGWNIPTREDVSVLPSLCGFVKDGLIGTGRQILRRIEELAAEFLESLSTGKVLELEALTYKLGSARMPLESLQYGKLEFPAPPLFLY
ncbi:hypothetical protein JG687_00000216 [Phytophthora cactorum]|uniref:Uncharacterized protein n=1 Tax=Phytophthora cactorum TaxID=29920 RepID=A0A8T1V5I5_9STRA|nr:hypothetical protein JG687_00000216 [Phytophthora cactorum]